MCALIFVSLILIALFHVQHQRLKAETRACACTYLLLFAVLVDSTGGAHPHLTRREGRRNETSEEF